MSVAVPASRWWLAGAAFLAALTVGPGVVHADPAEPTDYLSEVVAVSPPNDVFEVGIVGGDAFVHLEVAAGHEVEVAGYQGEPFIRVLPDGRVEENRRSPSWALSQDRLPSGALPDDVGVDLDPLWVEVSDDGSWVWHDHRVHWMGVEPPMGLGPGDQVVDGVIPLVVDGAAVEVRVVSTWQSRPSLWPALLGLLAGSMLVVLAVTVGRRRHDAWSAVTAVAAGAALSVGAWQYLSLPAATDPRRTAWLLPAAALVAALGAAVTSRRPRWVQSLLPIGALAVAGGELAVWVVVRRSVLTRAVLPTSAPWWLDRAVTSAVAAVSLAVLAWVARRLVTLPARQAQRSASM